MTRLLKVEPGKFQALISVNDRSLSKRMCIHFLNSKRTGVEVSLWYKVEDRGLLYHKRPGENLRDILDRRDEKTTQKGG